MGNKLQMTEPLQLLFFPWFPPLLQGSSYWKQNARKIYAVPEKDYRELQGMKRRRMRYGHLLYTEMYCLFYLFFC